MYGIVFFPLLSFVIFYVSNWYDELLTGTMKHLYTKLNKIAILLSLYCFAHSGRTAAHMTRKCIDPTAFYSHQVTH